MTMDDEPAGGGAEKIAGMLRGYYVAQAVYVAARLGLADLLARDTGSCMTAGQLAAVTGVHEDSLYRLLRALAGEGLFCESAGRQFTLAPAGQFLRADVPGSMRPAALVAGEMQYKVWSAFREAVKLGTPGFDRIFRQPLFPFFDAHPDMYDLFNQAMTQCAARDSAELASVCEMAAGETVIDVGGGLGNRLRAILVRFTGVRGVLLDASHVIEGARGQWTGDVAGRVELVAGDFFGAIPPGDVLVLGAILHMFPDAAARHILKNCRTALEASSTCRGGRIYLVENIIGEANASEPAKWDDLNMLMMTGGRERTLGEFESLLHAANFTRVRRVAQRIIEARAGDV